MVGTAPSVSPGGVAVSWLNPEWVRTDAIVFLKFTAVGTPKPKARPRTVKNKHTGEIQTYTPDDTVSWEGNIGWQAKQALAALHQMHPGQFDVLPLANRLMIQLRFNIKRPQSLPKKVLYPMKSRPGDIDNLDKCVLDALQNVGVIRDDCQVTDLDSMKRFADQDHPEGVEIQITGWLS
jgi:Holliday junction resolvase RusA-like endonuclease